MIKESMISCTEVLYAENLVTEKEKERLIRDIIDGKKRAYEVVSHKLQKLALLAHAEACKYI